VRATPRDRSCNSPGHKLWEMGIEVQTERRTIADSFDPRRNSLNFLRLVLASTVVVSHAIALGRFSELNGVNETAFGQIAVYGFFGISGFLIAGSAMRNHAGRYLWQRFLRIFPAFWVCLLVTAFGIGIVGWLGHPPIHCGLACYFRSKASPYSYIYRDFLLRMNQSSIAGTPDAGIASGVWNGSAWTLFYEFLCYVILMVLAATGLLRHRAATLGLSVSLWGTAVLITLTPALSSHFNLFDNDTPMNLIKFAAVFMVGAVVFLYAERIPDSGWLALACTGLFLASLYLPTGGKQPEFFFTASGLLAPLVAYPLLWLGIHLPLQRVGARNDYSYGLYIYGFPITQLLVIWRIDRWGFIPFTLLSVLLTAPLAVLSWWLVEKHALKLKSLRLRHPADLSIAPPVQGDTVRSGSPPSEVSQPTP
jgi:peptidoglycan/LPS O-acetylase OafA/YrhL